MRGRGHFGGKRETTKEMRGRKKKRDDAEKNTIGNKTSVEDVGRINTP